VRIGRGVAARAEPVWNPAGAGAELRLDVPDGFVSAEHARLRRVSGNHLLEDAGSSNGTLVNGERIETRLLEAGDGIESGRAVVRGGGRGVLGAARGRRRAWAGDAAARLRGGARAPAPGRAVAARSGAAGRERHRQGGGGAHGPRAVGARGRVPGGELRRAAG